MLSGCIDLRSYADSENVSANRFAVQDFSFNAFDGKRDTGNTIMTHMTMRKRSLAMGLIFIFCAILYGTAKFNSPFLVKYVVEQTLIQKAPPGTDPVKIHMRLKELLAQAPDRRGKIDILFRISRQLEKVQTLSHQDLVDLMEVKEAGALAI